MKKTVAALQSSQQVDQKNIMELQSLRAITQAEEQRLRDKILTMQCSMDVVQERHRTREYQIADLSQEKKKLADSLEALQQRCTTLEKCAQDIYPDYVEEDTETHL